MRGIQRTLPGLHRDGSLKPGLLSEQPGPVHRVVSGHPKTDLALETVGGRGPLWG